MPTRLELKIMVQGLAEVTVISRDLLYCADPAFIFLFHNIPTQQPNRGFEL